MFLLLLYLQPNILGLKYCDYNNNQDEDISPST